MNQRREVDFLESPKDAEIIITSKYCTHFSAQGT